MWKRNMETCRNSKYFCMLLIQIQYYTQVNFSTIHRYWWFDRGHCPTGRHGGVCLLYQVRGRSDRLFRWSSRLHVHHGVHGLHVLRSLWTPPHCYTRLERALGDASHFGKSGLDRFGYGPFLHTWCLACALLPHLLDPTGLQGCGSISGKIVSAVSWFSLPWQTCLVMGNPVNLVDSSFAWKWELPMLHGH